MKTQLLAAIYVAPFLVESAFASLRGGNGKFVKPERRLHGGGRRRRHREGGRRGPIPCEEVDAAIADVEQVLATIQDADLSGNVFADEAENEGRKEVGTRSRQKGRVEDSTSSSQSIFRFEGRPFIQRLRGDLDCDSLLPDVLAAEVLQQSLADIENNEMAAKMAFKMGNKLARVEFRCRDTAR